MNNPDFVTLALYDIENDLAVNSKKQPLKPGEGPVRKNSSFDDCDIDLQDNNFDYLKDETNMQNNLFSNMRTRDAGPTGRNCLFATKYGKKIVTKANRKTMKKLKKRQGLTKAEKDFYDKFDNVQIFLDIYKGILLTDNN